MWYVRHHLQLVPVGCLRKSCLVLDATPREHVPVLLNLAITIHSLRWILNIKLSKQPCVANHNPICYCVFMIRSSVLWHSFCCFSSLLHWVVQHVHDEFQSFRNAGCTVLCCSSSCLKFEQDDVLPCSICLDVLAWLLSLFEMKWSIARIPRRQMPLILKEPSLNETFALPLS